MTLHVTYMLVWQKYRAENRSVTIHHNLVSLRLRVWTSHFIRLSYNQEERVSRRALLSGGISSSVRRGNEQTYWVLRREWRLTGLPIVKKLTFQAYKVSISRQQVHTMLAATVQRKGESLRPLRLRRRPPNVRFPNSRSRRLFLSPQSITLPDLKRDKKTPSVWGWVKDFEDKDVQTFTKSCSWERSHSASIRLSSRTTSIIGWVERGMYPLKAAAIPLIALCYLISISPSDLAVFSLNMLPKQLRFVVPPRLW